MSLTQEQVCKIIYNANVLNKPLDQVFNILFVGDTTVPAQGLIGTITGITPSNYLKIVIKGSNRETRRYCSSVIKIDFNPDALTT